MKVQSIAVAELVNDPSNVRKHSGKNLDAIKGSLARFGQQKPIVVGPDGVVVAGNGTLEAAKALGWKKIDAVKTGLKGSDRTAFAIADNRSSELAEWDDAALAEQLSALAIDDEELLAAAGFDEAELERLISETIGTGDIVEDEAPEPPADPVTKAGDLWQLGDHRVLCGDSTRGEDVATLMGGEKADAVLTDPPYGTASKSKVQLRGGELKSFDIEWDKFAPVDWIPLAFGATKDGGATICFWECAGITRLWEAVKSAGLRPLHCVYWKKSIVPQPRKNFCSTVEAGVFARKPGKVLCWNGGGATANCFESNRAMGRERTSHETQKPMALWSELLALITNQKHLVLDPFLGSGTTLIAAEQLGRKCYGIEISPAYCDVIVERWQNLTGKKAKRVADGKAA